MKRIHRKAVSLFAFVALLFAQFAVSAYACPMLTQGSGSQNAAVSNSVSSADEPDAAQPGLCQAHCEDGQQNVNDSAPTLASVDFAPAFVVYLQLVDLPSQLTTTLFPSLLHATSPPIPIRNCCFRI
ncbi:MAG: hypothetical protein JNN20_02735 [Betaproteobacteria bacterium]|nr:hypothetical protein [Betaproteobacteria bacterium]